MRINHHHHHHRSWDEEVPPWAADLMDKVGLILDRQDIIMATMEELNTALGMISSEVDKVSADTDNLLAQLANIPPGGMTPEQQAALDAAVATATAISDRLKAIDDKVPDVNPNP